VSGLFCYSFFIITLWSFWNEDLAIWKYIFPCSILLSHLTRLLIIAKEKKSIILRFVSSIFNFILFTILTSNLGMDKFFTNVLHVRDDFADLYQFLFLFLFSFFPFIIAIKNLFKINEFHNMFTWKEIFSLQCYKKFPDLVRIEKQILLPVVLLICAYIIGNCYNIWFSLVALVPFCLLVYQRVIGFIDFEKIAYFFRVGKDR